MKTVALDSVEEHTLWPAELDVIFEAAYWSKMRYKEVPTFWRFIHDLQVAFVSCSGSLKRKRQMKRLG